MGENNQLVLPVLCKPVLVVTNVHAGCAMVPVNIEARWRPRLLRRSLALCVDARTEQFSMLNTLRVSQLRIMYPSPAPENGPAAHR